jgi:hypothetical protein
MNNFPRYAVTLLLLAAACGAESELTAMDARRLGAAAGVISPRLADCGEHCTKMLGDVTEPMTEALQSSFTQGCRTACEEQMAEAREPAWPKTTGCSELMSRMPTFLLEQRTWCNRELHDDSAEALALEAAFEAVKKSPEWVATQDLGRRARALAVELAGTEEGMREAAARDELARVHAAEGLESTAAEAARAVVGAANDAATATALGQRTEAARNEALAARCTANERAAMKDALEAFELHNQALRARFDAASPADQARMRTAMDSCIEAASTAASSR